MKYQKSRISINEQIALLTENKGLKCSDQSELERALVEANHYRLSAYWFPYKTKCKSGITIFREGTTFETIIYTYEFDRALRQLMFDAVGSAVGRIEIYLRSRIAYLASEERGPFRYPDVAITRLNSACPSSSAPHWATQPSLAAPPIRCSHPSLLAAKSSALVTCRCSLLSASWLTCSTWINRSTPCRSGRRSMPRQAVSTGNGVPL